MRKCQPSERGVRGTDSDTRDRDWFSTAKPGDEQISLKEHVERLMGRRALRTPCGCDGAVGPERRGEIHAVLRSFSALLSVSVVPLVFTASSLVCGAYS